MKSLRLRLNCCVTDTSFPFSFLTIKRWIAVAVMRHPVTFPQKTKVVGYQHHQERVYQEHSLGKLSSAGASNVVHIIPT